MISRLMISLKKASRNSERGWTSEALSRAHARTGTEMEFGPPSDGPEDGVGIRTEEVTAPDLNEDKEKSDEENVRRPSSS
jgi:hypothetical protein